MKLIDISTTSGHDNTVYKKQLMSFSKTNGKVATYNYAWLEVGMQLKPHSHNNGIEYFLFLEGKGKMLIDFHWFSVESGEFIVVKKNSTHSIINESKDKLIFMTLRTITD